MEISDEQIWDGEDSYAVFKSLMGEAFAPFATETVAEHNLTKMAEWGVSTLQGGVSAAKNVGFWDLSFKACLAAGTLQRDPGWIPAPIETSSYSRNGTDFRLNKRRKDISLMASSRDSWIQAREDFNERNISTARGRSCRRWEARKWLEACRSSRDVFRSLHGILGFRFR